MIFIFSGYTYLASSLVFTTVRRLYYLLIQASITILFEGSFRDSFKGPKTFLTLSSPFCLAAEPTVTVFLV